MLKYKIIERADPRDRAKPAKFYATPVSRGRKSIEQISVDVAGSSSLSRGDIQNVILSLVDQIPKYLTDGQSVELGELGTLRIGFSSEGVEKESDFNTSKISDLKIYFTPSTRLKDALNNIRFELES